MAEHAVQQVTIGFVGFIRFYRYAHIAAAVKRGMGAFVHQCGEAVIENAHQIKVFPRPDTGEMPAHSRTETEVRGLNAKRLLSLSPFLFATAEVNVRAVKKRYPESG
ncbi:hypothetical protein IFU23_06420 [Pantoea agglomerans]|uniref:hypothetical protein n=1 Tax=Enterobacter agglomerans TaxID=549 RepID=UPI001785B623|nr:hypothetical protein [Pantoea agglomerans]MBD8153811.1 hypothetical protein [Pantoea agglomerans]MBD8157741.1 hypothetical protein [Pantoea agglomerans]MBD8231580.1 hypothetical protein [Pantoea agglomerans]MBD8241725.1 hypothetical protein [Pantoea agglomerans]